VFGYVRPEKQELLMRDFTLYRAVYCGLCKAIGRRYGQLPRLSLTYDMTFLSLLLLAFSTVEPVIVREACILNPVKKKPVAAHPLLDYAADLSCLLAYESSRDDARDDKPVRGRLVSSLFYRSARKAAEARPSAALIVSEGLERLSAMEEGPPSLDAADCFGAMLGGLFEDGFTFLLSDEKAAAANAERDDPGSGMEGNEPGIRAGGEEPGEKAEDQAWYSREDFPDLYTILLREAGCALGRWVYLMDALDDLNEDRASGSWNPLAGQDDAGGTAEALLIEAEEAVDRNLALLTYERFGSLVYNIVAIGLPAARGRIMAGERLPRV